jgi:hypothetical protein
MRLRIGARRPEGGASVGGVVSGGDVVGGVVSGTVVGVVSGGAVVGGVVVSGVVSGTVVGVVSGGDVVGGVVSGTVVVGTAVVGGAVVGAAVVGGAVVEEDGAVPASPDGWVEPPGAVVVGPEAGPTVVGLSGRMLVGSCGFWGLNRGPAGGGGGAVDATVDLSSGWILRSPSGSGLKMTPGAATGGPGAMATRFLGCCLVRWTPDGDGCRGVEVDTEVVGANVPGDVVVGVAAAVGVPFVIRPNRGTTVNANTSVAAPIRTIGMSNIS